MTDISPKVSAGADDGYATKTTGANFDNSSGSVKLGLADNIARHAFFRFQNVGIPEGATIDSAVLRLYAESTYTASPLSLKVHVEDDVNPSAPSDGSDLVGRSLSTGVSWSIQQFTGAGNTYDSSDFKDDLQSVIDDPSWIEGNAITIHVIHDSGAVYYQRVAESYEGNSSWAAELLISYTGAQSDSIDSQLSMSSEFDAIDFYAAIESGLAFSSEFDYLDPKGDIDSGIDLSGDFGASKESSGDIANGFNLQGAFDAIFEIQSGIADQIEFAGEFDAFNWSQWLRLNKARAIERFYFTLTGSADGQSDIEIPISSFQARKRSGESTYLSVVISKFDSYSGAVAARPNGEMVIELAYILDGEESVREEIIRADLEEIAKYEGPTNRSITLTGHKTQTFEAKTVTLQDAIYKSSTNARRLFRFAQCDPYLNPGDTAIIGDDSFTVDYVQYIFSEGYKVMETREIG